LSFLAIPGFSQTLIGLYGGGGCATSNNYDIAPSGGLEMLFKGSKAGRMYIGADLFYQGYSLYADNEANSSKHGTGNAGTIDRFAASYVYLAPKFSYGIGKKQALKIYFDVGIGYNINGFDSLRKFDRGYYTNGYYTAYNAGIGQYDSTIDKTSNINKMMFRMGVGATEYFSIGSSWAFTITEDFGFVTTNLTTTGTVSDPSRTNLSTNGLRPGYISLQIGISHIGKGKTD
jgi:hypothetical protein